MLESARPKSECISSPRQSRTVMILAVDTRTGNEFDSAKGEAEAESSLRDQKSQKLKSNL